MFIWQEEFMTPKWALKKVPLVLGADVTPEIEHLGSLLDGFPQTSDYVVQGKSLYPGSHHCDRTSPHALWHQSSADGLFDLVLLCDYVYGLL